MRRPHDLRPANSGARGGVRRGDRYVLYRFLPVRAGLASIAAELEPILGASSEALCL